MNTKAFIGAMNTKISIRKEIKDKVEEVLASMSDDELDNASEEEVILKIIGEIGKSRGILVATPNFEAEFFDTDDIEDEEDDDWWKNSVFKG